MGRQLLVAGLVVFILICLWGFLVFKNPAFFHSYFGSDTGENTDTELTESPDSGEEAYEGQELPANEDSLPGDSTDESGDGDSLPSDSGGDETQGSLPGQVDSLLVNEFIQRVRELPVRDPESIMNLSQELKKLSGATLTGIFSGYLEKHGDSYGRRYKAALLASRVSCSCLTEFWKGLLSRHSGADSDPEPVKKLIHVEQLIAARQLSRLVHASEKARGILRDIILDRDTFTQMARQRSYEGMKKYDPVYASNLLSSLEDRDPLRQRFPDTSIR